MIDESFIREQIDNLIAEKQYDNRTRPMLVNFFTALTNRYNYTEDQLLSVIEKYKDKVNTISFYNIGIDKYIYTSSKDLIFDRDIVEDINRGNVDKFIQTFIKANSRAAFGVQEKDFTDIVSIASLYDQPEDFYVNLNRMLAAAFEVEPKDVLMLNEIVLDKVKEYDRSKNPNEYDYYNTANTLMFTISDRLKDIQDEKGIKEAYKAIFAACLLNMNVKIHYDKLGTKDAALNYAKLLRAFNEYREKFGIEESELDSVSLNDRNWKIDVNNFMKILEEKFEKIPDIPEESEDEKPYSIKRSELIAEQSKENLKVNRNISKEEISKKVDSLIEQKGYPIEFEEVLREFFIRSAEDFEWDRETVDKKIKNFALNVNEFKYEKMETLDALAQYDAFSKSIKFNKILMFSSKDTVISTIMHELKHATDVTYIQENRVEEGFEDMRDRTEEEMAGLNELVTEASAVKVAGRKVYTEEYATTYRLDGYNNLSCATSMISAAFGMSESEFLKLANKGEDKFKNVMDNRYPNAELPRRIDEIDKIVTMIAKAGIAGSRKYEIMGYGKLYNILNDISDIRIINDIQAGRYNEVKSRYFEYKLNRNMAMIQGRMFFPRRISKDMPDYKEVSEKATLTFKEREEFAKIGMELQSEYPVRDNKELFKSVKGIKKYIHRSKKRGKMLKLNPAQEEASEGKDFNAKRQEFLSMLDENIDVDNNLPQKNKDENREISENSENVNQEK